MCFSRPFRNPADGGSSGDHQLDLSTLQLIFKNNNDQKAGAKKDGKGGKKEEKVPRSCMPKNLKLPGRFKTIQQPGVTFGQV